MDVNQFPLWTAVITPFFEDGQVDYESLTKILKDQESAKNGILILGSTGEALNLQAFEKKSILEYTLNLKLSVPVMCGVGGSDLIETQNWLEYLETLPIDCYLMVTPLYAKPGRLGQYYWFKKLLDLSSRPVALYNVPSRTGVSLNFKTVEMLKDHPRFWAIKEASGSTKDFAQYKKMAPNAKIFSGDDALLPAFKALGAEGLISVASNVWPKETHLYVDRTLANQISETEKELWSHASNSLFLASNPVPVKRLMAHKKMIKTAITKAPLHHLDLESIAPLVSQDQKVETWFQNQA